ncbi:Periplasmic thiol:disulfide interchange protein DsbA [Acidisarcina polymorpha]|uniref:Periplasmic thiol:disulfide interchange protein DsbA n=1 Tax=Acidisarcina polymorpha TaxID=2211140 RepID=A0A2Z5G8I4_9BACT|nr:thioredoxin domain-containing protein [Acidisarcina polymorpha]AXC15391.1 Periplasmic thiol:disulfide interchange protein DsbA [Acidisarcina polymorpha]
MTTLKVSVGADDHVKGDENAPCTLVEYGDYECPHCARAVPIVKRLEKHFGKRLRLVFRHFPLSQLHPHAESAAETAEFAAAGGKFWEMHDLLFDNQDRLGMALYEELVEELNLSGSEWSKALESKVYLPHVRDDFAGGVRSGVNGTPTFFINGKRNNGPFDYEYLAQAIDDALRAHTG